MWNTPGMPHKGWRCFEVYDLAPPGRLGRSLGACEMCGTEIRFAHLMTHTEWPSPVTVGCICAGHMEGDRGVRARAREHGVKLRIDRRARWLTRKWKTSRNGNPYLKAAGQLVVLFRKENGWGCKVGDVWGESYPDVVAAKFAAFDMLYPEHLAVWK